MTIYKYITLLIFSILSVNCFAQSITDEELVNKFWAINKYEIAKVQETDTLTIEKSVYTFLKNLVFENFGFFTIISVIISVLILAFE